MRTRIGLTVFALLVGAGAVAAGTAQADVTAKAQGRLTLYSPPSSGGQSRSIVYEGCQGTFLTNLLTVRSFHNLPPAGCAVSLVNGQGQAYQLCQGRADVPAAFTGSRRVQLRAGVTRPCPSAGR